ncbi:MAG: CYCXC family (seleno)protein [Terracidiphilus sp.]
MKNPVNARLLPALGVFLLTLACYAQWTNPNEDIPAYHAHAPLNASALPPILSGAKLTGPEFQYAWQLHAYHDAARIGNVLYQLPCNCRCDRELGHTSLRSCFEGLHAAECSTCAKEGFYAYQQTRLGRTPAQIRAGILKHAYETIDLEKM